MKLSVTPIAGALGAEIAGVDLGRSLDAAAVAEIRQALLDHLVIFFPAQDLTPKSLLAFARCLGEPLAYPQLQGLPEEPLVTAVTKSEGLQRTLAGLTAVYTSTKPAVAATREDRLRERGVKAKVLTSEHSVVRTHPETGRKALYVNRGHTSHFKGWSEAESEPLLEYLFQLQVRPEITCRYRWQPSSLAVWDNRCTQHLPINDYHGFRRVMHRVTLAGDRPS